MQFELDDAKAKINLRKHGVSFDEAVTVFADPLELALNDPEHSEGEYCFLSLGMPRQLLCPVGDNYLVRLVVV